MTPNECVFCHIGMCDHTGDSCKVPCRWTIRPIPGLAYRDHFDLFEKRRYQRKETWLKYIAILISIIALMISGLGVVWQVQKSGAGRLDSTRGRVRYGWEDDVSQGVSYCHNHAASSPSTHEMIK